MKAVVGLNLLFNNKEFNNGSSSINNNDDKNNNGYNGKTVNNEGDLDEALQQGESSTSKGSSNFKKKKTFISPENVAIFGASVVKHVKSH